MAFGWTWMIVIAGLVVWGVSSLTRLGSHEQSQRSPVTGSSALGVLEMRYASGELNDEQFEHMRRQLRQSPASEKGTNHGDRITGSGG